MSKAAKVFGRILKFITNDLFPNIVAELLCGVDEIFDTVKDVRAWVKERVENGNFRTRLLADFDESGVTMEFLEQFVSEIAASRNADGASNEQTHKFAGRRRSEKARQKIVGKQVHNLIDEFAKQLENITKDDILAVCMRSAAFQAQYEALSNPATAEDAINVNVLVDFLYDIVTDQLPQLYFKQMDARDQRLVKVIQCVINKKYATDGPAPQIPQTTKETLEELPDLLNRMLPQLVECNKGTVTWAEVKREQNTVKYIYRECPNCGYYGSKLVSVRSDNDTRDCHCPACGKNYAEIYDRAEDREKLQELLEKQAEKLGVQQQNTQDCVDALALRLDEALADLGDMQISNELLNRLVNDLGASIGDKLRSLQGSSDEILRILNSQSWKFELSEESKSFFMQQFVATNSLISESEKKILSQLLHVHDSIRENKQTIIAETQRQTDTLTAVTQAAAQEQTVAFVEAIKEYFGQAGLQQRAAEEDLAIKQQSVEQSQQRAPLTASKKYSLRKICDLEVRYGGHLEDMSPWVAGEKDKEVDGYRQDLISALREDATAEQMDSLANEMQSFLQKLEQMRDKYIAAVRTNKGEGPVKQETKRLVMLHRDNVANIILEIYD